MIKYEELKVKSRQDKENEVAINSNKSAGAYFGMKNVFQAISLKRSLWSAITCIYSSSCHSQLVCIKTRVS